MRASSLPRPVFALPVLLLTTFCTPSKPAPAISAADFEPASGAWNGTLTYLDYTSGNPFTMPAGASLTVEADRVLFSVSYPDEPQANSTDTLTIESAGAVLDGETVVSTGKSAEGLQEIVTEKQGVDGNDNRAAVIRHTYRLSKDILEIRKEVRFEGEENWLLRNTYAFTRSTSSYKHFHGRQPLEFVVSTPRGNRLFPAQPENC